MMVSLMHGNTTWSQWHSTAMPKAHGSFGIERDVPLAGVVPRAGSEDFVLSSEHATCGMNLANGASCSVRRPPLAPRRGQYATTESERWLRGVQDTCEGSSLFTRETHLGFTKELYKDSKCSPSQYGATVQFGSSRLFSTMRFDGAGLCGTQTGVPAAFTASLDAPASQPLGEYPLELSARLVGPSIIAASASFSHVAAIHGRCKGGQGLAQAGCQQLRHQLRATFEYTVADGDHGVYVLEMLLSHAAGVDFHQLVYRGVLRIFPPASTPAAPLLQQPGQRAEETPTQTMSRRPAARACSSGAHAGRWVQVDRRAHPAIGRIADDALGYNRGYWWQPYKCSYTPFGAQELLARLGRCGLWKLGFSGDSLGREPMAGVAQILRGDDASFFNLDGRDFKPDVVRDLTLGAKAAKRVTLTWNWPRDARSAPDAFLYSSQPVMRLASSNGDVAKTISTITLEMAAYAAACNASRILCVVQLNPAVHRRWPTKGHPSGYGHGYGPRQVADVVSATRKLATALGLPILDSFAPSRARWDASWDGCHYTFNIKAVNYSCSKAPLKWQWQGGVSAVNTLVYFNMLIRMCEARMSRGGHHYAHYAGLRRWFGSDEAESDTKRAETPLTRTWTTWLSGRG